MLIKKIIPVLLFTVLMTGCNSTKIRYSWKAPNIKTKPFYNMMVWGLMIEKDSSLRKQMEIHLVNDLINHGYHAVSSMDVYKDKAFKNLTANEILAEFKSTGIDAVITIALLKKEKEERFFPGGYNTDLSSAVGDLNNYYSGIMQSVFTPGYYITTTNYFWESRLFEVKDEKMIYTARTRSFDPENTETLAHENGIIIIKNMINKKVIVNTLPKED